MNDEHKHFVGPVAQKAILEMDGKVLLTKGVGDGDVWELPGGRLHEGEILAEGLQREITEELGVDVGVGPIVYAEQFIHQKSDQNHLLLAYLVSMKNPTQAFMPNADEVENMRWIDESQLHEQKIYDNYLHALEAYFLGKNKPEAPSLRVDAA
jgi:ADP-ribose pyrophosphatase YjhB (NUDIX family)